MSLTDRIKRIIADLRGARYDLYRLSTFKPGYGLIPAAMFIWPSDAGEPHCPQGHPLRIHRVAGNFCANRRLKWLHEHYRRIMRNNDLPLFECLDGKLSDELVEFVMENRGRIEGRKKP